MNSTNRKIGIVILGLAGLSLCGSSVQADDWAFSLGGQGRWVEPVYATQPRTVVIPAQYEERARKVWHEPVYEERRTLVQVPPRTETRQVPRYVNGQFAGYDQQVVVVESGRQEWRTERVLVQPGRWETIVDRVLVQPERTEIVYEQVMVSAGYWEPASGISFGYVDRHDDDDDDHHRRRVYVGPRGTVRVRR
jgi:hypothetical protein